MRRYVLALLALVLLAAGGLVLHGRSGPAAADPRLVGLRRAATLQPCPAGLGPELPDVTLPCLGGGKPVALRAAPPGRPMLVNIWGSWCPPCVAEVPALVAAARAGAEKLSVVGIDDEDDPINALTFAAQYGMHYPSLVDDNKVVLRTFAPGPPVTLFLDARGHIAYRHLGQFHSLAQISSLVAAHLGVQL